MKLLALDSNSILNRAFYGVRLLTTKDGAYTNAIFGFISILQSLLGELEPDAVALAFDLRGPTFRHKLFPEYKAGRKGMPPELASQLEPLRTLLHSLGYTILELEGFEADDILGTLAARCTAQGWECCIATGDRDSLQLVGEGVSVRLATTKQGQPTATLYDEALIRETYGVPPAALLDVKALMGDASDNIPGVAGIGEKGALELIRRFGSLDGVYAQLDDPAIRESTRKKLIAGRERAQLSRTLGAIRRDLPLDAPLSSYKRAAGDAAAAYRLLEGLEMYSTIKRLGLSQPPVEEVRPAVPAAPQESEPTLAQGTLAALKALLEPAPAPEEPPLGLLPELAQERVIGLAVSRCGQTLYFTEEALLPEALRTTFASALKKSTSEAKELYRAGIRAGVTPQALCFDAQLAAYLLNPLATDYALERLFSQYGVAVPEGEAPLFARRCAALPMLAASMSAALGERGLSSLLTEMELPLAEVLASMEEYGFTLDSEGLIAYGKELDTELSALTERIYTLAGERFNLNSPKQLGEVLYNKLGLPVKKKTKTGPSTNAEVLEALRPQHEIIGELLEYRKLAKLKSTYVDGLLSELASDGCIHTRFRQTETRTGRISSTEPNLQNIPVRTALGSRLRRFFLPQAGWVLVDADYSQIELRVLAHISADPAMTAAFLSGEDIHTATAAKVFDLPAEYVTSELRRRAKAVNFGIVYGIGAFSLSQDIGVSVAEADRYIKDYLETYSGVRRYMEETIAYGRENGVVRTMFGRQRPVPELASANRNTRTFGERVAMNSPIQGTAADIIKLAMVRVYKRLQREALPARLILQVHDELIVECEPAAAERVARALREEMEQAAALSVPLIAETKQGENWYAAK